MTESAQAVDQDVGLAQRLHWKSFPSQYPASSAIQHAMHPERGYKSLCFERASFPFPGAYPTGGPH